MVINGSMKILVTGAAGFVGFHLSRFLLERGDEVVGLDNINDYYDVRLKYARLQELGVAESVVEWGKCVASSSYAKFSFVRMGLEDTAGIYELFEREQFDKVCNLAAQAGVRYSLENPQAYIQSNVVGFVNILEASRLYGIKHLVYASSSSVYGQNSSIPFSTEDRVDHPVSLYAATKKSNELMAHTYSHLYQLPTTGLRFFTVYGPWGRPDMAYFLFAEAIRKGDPIKVFNHGDMQRDFTYIDDIITGTVKVIDHPPVAEAPPYEVYNIGNNQPVSLLAFIETIEQAMGQTAEKVFLPMQPGDVYRTYADVTPLMDKLGYQPTVGLDQGIAAFVQWYNQHQTLFIN